MLAQLLKHRASGLPQPLGTGTGLDGTPCSLSLRFMSSVFVSPQGKFIRINFDVNGYIVGANIETCILMADGIKRWDIVGGGSP
jgi:hypothetical protein